MPKYIPILFLFFSELVFADAYVDASKPFAEIENADRQVEAWAVCAASYDVMSTIMEANAPARAQQLRQLGHGAKLSVGMALIANDLDPEISLERFKALWAKAQEAMTEHPQRQLTSILADAERLGTDGAQEFGQKINATVVACINNLEGQRTYVDSWQQLIESGLLAPPDG